jgi:hypothetical protein
MSFEIIAQGEGLDVNDVVSSDSLIKSGEAVELRFYVESAPCPHCLAEMKNQFLSQGILINDIAYDSGILVIRVTKTQPVNQGVAFWPVVGIIAAGVAALGVGIFSWQMGKDVGSALANPIVIVSGIVLIWLFFFRKPQMEGNQYEIQP